MDTIKREKTEIIEIMDTEDPSVNGETESPYSVSEDSESGYEHLKPTGWQICTDNFSGQFNFEFFVDQSEVTKRHWMYSEKLNKIFLDMNRVVPIQFHWDFDETELLGMRNLRIRALLIFANPEFEQLSIKRCPVHIIQDKFCDKKKVEHILWCEQYDSIYEEDPQSQRYSVVAHVHNSIPYSENKTYNVMYKFMCKSSCSMSLNRRAINVIFTLETAHGAILGRKKLGVKICSCPRRDSIKEEEFEKKKRLNAIKNLKKRPLQVSNNDVSKKITKTNNEKDENKSYVLPLLAVPSKKLYINTLELLHGHFLGCAVRDDTLIDSHPLISMLADLISQVKSESNNYDIDVDSKNSNK